MKLRFPIFLISLLLVLLFSFSSSSKPIDPFLGIAPQGLSLCYDLLVYLFIYLHIIIFLNLKFHLLLDVIADVKYFKSHDVIRCKDGSANFNKEQLNDDFCDCPDGTDEPGLIFYIFLFINDF